MDCATLAILRRVRSGGRFRPRTSSMWSATERHRLHHVVLFIFTKFHLLCKLRTSGLSPTCTVPLLSAARDQVSSGLEPPSRPSSVLTGQHYLLFAVFTGVVLRVTYHCIFYSSLFDVKRNTREGRGQQTRHRREAQREEHASSREGLDCMAWQCPRLEPQGCEACTERVERECGQGLARRRR